MSYAQTKINFLQNKIDAMQQENDWIFTESFKEHVLSCYSVWQVEAGLTLEQFIQDTEQAYTEIKQINNELVQDYKNLISELEQELEQKPNLELVK
ncbi:hypothetical protein Q5V23_004422 [Vibrio fluvialis]|nr:hypothetical protein [Vibrio fluvialis]ELL4670528.1 hypothetical protein [Vibrio fluvialis]